MNKFRNLVVVLGSLAILVALSVNAFENATQKNPTIHNNKSAKPIKKDIKLPSIKNLDSEKLIIPIKMYDIKGKVEADFTGYSHISLSYDKIPKLLVQAVVIIEDKNHFKLKAPNVSKITKLIARLLLLAETQSYERYRNSIFISFRKLLLAQKIEKKYSKEKIIKIYLNQMYLGYLNFGIEAAAQFYFRKSINMLSLAQQVTLVVMIPAPTYYHPIRHASRVHKKRSQILKKMYNLKLISDKQYQLGINEKVIAKISSE